MNKIIYSISLLFSTILMYACGGNAQSVKINDKAPDFKLEDAYGNSYQLSSFIGKSPVVIYFYPKANTPGCTKQACGIRDNFSKFSENNIQVFGISVDSKESLKSFIDEYNLNFPLLSDETKEISKKYDVLNKLGFANRVTFIIDKEGKVSEIIKNVDVTTHADDIYNKAEKLR